MSSESRPYQGYPYVNPATIEAPSLTQDQVAQMAKWANLPKRGVGGVKGESDRGKPPSRPEPETLSSSSSGTEDDIPVVYIDMPEDNAGGGVSVRNEPSTPESAQTSKDNEAESPVVYIDMPEENGSNVSQVPNRVDDEASSFVQETIYFDQFKGRRIDEAGSSQNGLSSRPARPPPPNNLNVSSAGTSGYASIESSLPPFLSKEAYIYGRPQPQDDDFRLTPLSVNEFPPPPPAYTEIDPRRPLPAPVPVLETNEPPRTQVILPGPQISSTGVPLRKYYVCQYCNHEIPTLVARDTGIFSRGVACVCFFTCFPLIYCNKQQNHYCPNCNHCVAYDIPLVCTDVRYTR